MANPVNGQEKIGFFAKHSQGDQILRMLLAFIAILGLTLFLQFRQHRVDLLELDSVADQYIVAQVEFEFPDRDSMVIFKQETLNTIGAIYQIPQKSLRGVLFEFENFLFHDKQWKQKLPSSNYEELDNIGHALENVLLDLRFSDPRTIQTMKDLNLDVENYFIFLADKEAENILPREYWQNIKEDMLISNIVSQLPGAHKEEMDFVVQFFISRTWPLIEDSLAEKEVKSLIEKKLPQKFTKVKPGTQIVAPGERVTAKHLAIMQAMQQSIRESVNPWSPMSILGNFLLSFVLVFLSGLYLCRNFPDVYKSVQKISLLVCIIILTLAFAKVSEYVLIQNSGNVLNAIRYPILVPFAAILLTILLNTRIALYASFWLAILMTVTLAVENSRFLIINTIVPLIAVISSRSLSKRKEIFLVCGKCFLGALPIIGIFGLIANNFWSIVLAYDILSSCVFLLITAILVVGLLPILESFFNVMTDMSLMEYMDPNNELLRRLILEMPATYQHSLVLGNIAEVAARAIGANGLLCKVATLYHDIGKLNHVSYFTENQQAGVDIHQLLTPVESAHVIISHIKDGELLAKKHRLPQSFIDIIKEHHGTTLVYYFYCKEVENKGGHIDQVDEKLFRYPGPKPRSKESAIIMLSDAAEAASRSIEVPTEELLTEMMNRVVSDRIEDGQFDECPLSFQELVAVKDSIIKTLLVTRHVRIKYPEKKERFF